MTKANRNKKFLPSGGLSKASPIRPSNAQGTEKPVDARSCEDLAVVDPTARARGSFLGLAFGDALGAPIETWSKEEIAQIFPGGYALPSEYSPAYMAALGEGGLSHLRLPGLHTDDTQQAMALLAVAAAPGGFSRRFWADWLLSGMRLQAWRGYGRNFAAAVKALGRGGDAALSTSGSPSAGNGAAMRSGPLGALLRLHPETLRLVSIEASLMTHADLRAALVAYAVAYSVSRLTLGEEPTDVAASLAGEVRRARLAFLASGSGREFGAVAQEKADQVEKVLTQIMKALSSGRKSTKLQEAPDLGRSLFSSPAPSAGELREALVQAVGKAVGDEVAGKDLHPNQGLALLSGLHGLLSGLLLQGSPLAILTDLVEQGKDTDTAGAIAGSVLGARFGDSWIPVGSLLDARRLGLYAQFVAEPLAGLSAADSAGGDGPSHAVPETMSQFLGAEAELTRREGGFCSTVRQKLGR